jgi:iron complex transport system substrate-binding protein
VPNRFRSLPAALVAIAVVALGAGCGDDGEDIASTGTAAASAYALVFDSTVAFDEKAPHLEEADALMDTVEKYATAAQSFNGIKLTPTAVTITGHSAAVTYDVYFGTTKQYSSLPGTIENRDGTWTVSRDEFCGFMASARTPCAA